MKKFKIKILSAITALTIAVSASAAAIAANTDAAEISATAKTVYGDVDHDGYVSTMDAILVMKASIRAITLSKDNLTAAGMTESDLNLNGAVKVMKTSISAKIIRVTGASVKANSKSVKVGDSFQIGASVSPSNATNKYFSYKSSDSKIATVDSSGKITAKAAGKATVTATTVDGRYSAKCQVTVTAPQPEGTMSISGATYKICDNYSENYLYDQRKYSKFVEYGSNVGCSATSEAIGASMYYGKKIAPDSSQIGWISGVGATFSLAKYRYNNCSLNYKLDIAYKQLQKGNPTIFNTAGNYGNDHWVTVIGVKTNANASSLKTSDFLIVDPWGGVLKNFGTYLSDNGRTVPNSYSMRAYEK